MLQDEMRHVQWLQMALAGQMPGPGMGYTASMVAPPACPVGQVVLPNVAHMPEHANRAARVMEVVTDRPFYALDFGDGVPHRWYAHDELQPASEGVQPRQEVPGATGQRMEH